MCLNLRDPSLHRGGLRMGGWTFEHSQPTYPGAPPTASRAQPLSFRHRSVGYGGETTDSDIEMEADADADSDSSDPHARAY